jgi:hypothetical protein
MNYGLIAMIMLAVSILASWGLIKHKYNQKATQVKWVLFVLYFWLLNFIQLIFLALVYKLM